jgi:hypothetical protein
MIHHRLGLQFLFLFYLDDSGADQLEGLFIDDPPLPVSTRIRIIELAHNGMHPRDISRCVQVSKRCVSEI